MNQSVEMATATVLWTLAGALGVTGMLEDVRRLMFCAVMVGLVATVATTHMLIEHAVKRERVCLESLVDSLIDNARQRVEEAAAVPRLRR